MSVRTYTIKIDDSVPLAEKNSARVNKGSRYQHPLSFLLRKLKLNEAFIYPAATCEDFGNLRSLAHYNSKALGRTFTTRMVRDHEDVARLRFWRTA